MSNWSDLESRCNPAFSRTFGQDAMTYQPKDDISDPYDIVLVIGSPENVEGVDAAYCHAWAPADSFHSQPQQGDVLIASSGREYTVFSVHTQTIDGALEPQTIWLSLNLA